MTEQIANRRTQVISVATKLLYNEPWAILPEKLDAVISAIDRIFINVEQAQPDVKAAQPSLVASSNMNIGVLNISGVLSYRAGMFGDSSGGQSIERTQSAFRSLQARDDVEQILLNIDSPGGSVAGIQEFADEIFSSKKKVTAIANPVAASAAFWIFSAAKERFVIPSGQVGSVGVIAVHADTSKANEAEGYKYTIIQAGKFKSEGSPLKPLDEEGMGYLQSTVNSYYTDFVSSLAKFSGHTTNYVEERFGQGRMLRADAAKTNDMVNKIMTFDETLSYLQSKGKVNSQRKALAQRYAANS